MAYVDPNFKTKKLFKEAVAAGYEPITIYQPFMGEVPTDGYISVEGPHYPEPHRWYARVKLVDGKVVEVR